MYCQQECKISSLQHLLVHLLRAGATVSNELVRVEHGRKNEDWYFFLETKVSVQRTSIVSQKLTKPQWLPGSTEQNKEARTGTDLSKLSDMCEFSWRWEILAARMPSLAETPAKIVYADQGAIISQLFSGAECKMRISASESQVASVFMSTVMLQFLLTTCHPCLVLVQQILSFWVACGTP